MSDIRPEIKQLLHERRFTRFLNLTEDVPWVRGECAWCGAAINRGVKYCNACRDDVNIRASGTVVKYQVFARDRGICARCGMDCAWVAQELRFIRKLNLYIVPRVYTESLGPYRTRNHRLWEAHHIIPVHKGGGVCGLENYETLCLRCHKGAR